MVAIEVPEAEVRSWVHIFPKTEEDGTICTGAAAPSSTRCSPTQPLAKSTLRASCPRATKTAKR